MKKPIEAEFLCVGEVATKLGISTNSVIRKFAQLAGVVDLGTPERMNKRRKRCLRIPKAVLEQFVLEHQTNRRK
jgi:hypothetical protein